jgi:murein DD-endopeptidase MepM/ murein hydrolase activator NlpD
MSYDDLKQAPGIVIEKIEGRGDVNRGPRSGDVVHFRNAQGETYITQVQDDEGTLNDPVPGAPTAPGTRAEAAAARADATEKRVAATSAATQQRLDNAEQARIIADNKKQLVDYTAAQGAVLAHEKLTQSQLDALAAGPGPLGSQGQSGGQAAGGGYAFPVPGFTGDLGPHHAGNPNGATDIFAQPGAPVVAAAGGKVIRAGQFGAAGNDIVIQGDDGKFYDYEHVDGLKVGATDTVKAGQPIAEVATLDNAGSSVGPVAHLHFAVANSLGGINYNDHGTASLEDGSDTLAFLKGLPRTGVTAGTAGTGGWTPEQLAAVAGAGAAKSGTTHQLGNQLWYVGPNGENPHVIATGPPTAPVHVNWKGEGGQEMMASWDPTANGGTGAWTTQVIGAADLSQTDIGKLNTMMQQADASQKANAAAYKAGTITQQQFLDYSKYLTDYVDAAWQGTTPFERYKFAQQQQTINTQTAKDLLDTAVTNTTKTASDLLNNTTDTYSKAKYATALPADALYNIFQGGLNAGQQTAKPLTDLANQLLAGVGSKALSAGLDPRTAVLAGQAPPSSIVPSGAPPPSPPDFNNGPTAETLRPDAVAA